MPARTAPIPLAWLTGIACVLVLNCSAGAATVHVDFNDLAPGPVNGQFGGIGLDSAEAWGNNATLNVVAGDLAAPTATHYALTQSGAAQSLQGSSGVAVQSTRALAAPLGGIVWFSFLLRQPDSAARSGLTFNTDTNTAAVLPRVVAVGGSIFVDYGSDAQDVWLSNALVLNQTTLVVGRIELDISSDNRDRLSLWVDPDVVTPGPPAAVLEGNDPFGSTITRIGLVSYHANGTVGGIIDAVAIANGPEAYAAVTGVAGGDYTLAFSDEFDQEQLDTAAWSLDPVRHNVDVSAGLLRLLTTADGESWTTGKITSAFTQRFGYFEARYRIGADTGLNNAFWLSTPDDIYLEPNGSPQTVDRTEVDINETHYPDELNMTLHDWSPVHVGVKHASVDVGANLAQSFHTYAFEWRTDNRMIWYFDGTPYLTASAAEVNSARTSLPLAVLFSTKVAPFAGSPGPNLDGTSMDVDYVRAYRRTGWSGAVSSDWSEPANWGPDGVPGPDEAAVFNGPTSQPIVNLAADVSLREVYIAGPDTPGMTFATGHTLTLGDVSGSTGVASITVNPDVAHDQTFDLPIVGIHDLIIANYSRLGACLILNGGLDGLAPGRLAHFGGGAIDVNGSIGGNIADVINFAGATTRLTAANSHTGPTEIRGGTLIVAADGALGAVSSSGPTRVLAGATLALADGVQYAAAEPLYVAGAGTPDGVGAITVADDSSVAWSTNVWLTADATISSGLAGGELTVGGLINAPDASGRTVTLAGSGTLQLDGILGTRVIGILKMGSGAAVLSSPSNLNAGTTTIAEGTLALGTSGTTGQSSLIAVQTNGTFEVSARGGYSVTSGRTLSNNGTVVGEVTLAAGATLEGRGVQSGHVTALGGATIRVGPDEIINPQTVAIVADADVRIRSGEPATNPGGDTPLAVGPVAAADVFRTLLRFPLDAIPADALLVGNPVLTLTGAGEDAASVASAPKVEVRRLLNSFDENEATWLQRSAATPWMSPGGDMGTLLVSSSGPDPDAFEAGDRLTLASSTLTGNLQAALGSPEWNVIIRTDSETSEQRSFYWLQPSESPDPPMLSVTYGTRNTLGTLTFADGLDLQSGATIIFEVGAPGDLLRISGGMLTGPQAGAVTIEITNADVATTGVYALADWHGAGAEVVASDFMLSEAIPDAHLVVADDQLLLAILPPAQRYDFDRNGAVDLADAAVMLAALTGPSLPAQPVVSTADFVRADSDYDGDVDLADFADFQRWFSTP
ncbi:MAG TPA: family 16 glycosylhydrolase [Phycisphaerae bacterium]|nr:family 16 glycosylhydrolase [Phycisphaerae bacterium]